jgi:cell wall-associated NlpC family hydrolase
MARAAFGMVFLAFATPLWAQRAQPSWVFEASAARKDPANSPLFGGIALTHYHRILGVRLGGSAHFDGAGTQAVCDQFGCQEPVSAHLTAWTADADLILDPLRVTPLLRKLLLGFSPYGFVGIGGYGVRGENADSSIPTVRYGVGLHHDLVGALGIQAEARYRRPLSGDSANTAILREKLAYSIGVRIGFGGHSKKTPKTAKSTPPPPTTTTARVPTTVTPRVSEENALRFASSIIDLAESYLDKPYTYGGASPYGGFDAAGFVQYVFARAGVRLPRTAREISTMGEAVSLKVGSLRTGDLLFFASDGSKVDHVAIYAGHERIIHATASGGGVRYDTLGEGERGRWFSDHLVSACRIVGTLGSGAKVLVDPSTGKTLDPPDVAPPSPRAQ